MRFNPRISILAGMHRHDLEAHLRAIQECVLQLAAGAKIFTASYAQGDGTRSATYTQADMANATAMILELQAQLGMRRVGRRPMRFGYR